MLLEIYLETVITTVLVGRCPPKREWSVPHTTRLFWAQTKKGRRGRERGGREYGSVQEPVILYHQGPGGGKGGGKGLPVSQEFGNHFLSPALPTVQCAPGIVAGEQVLLHDHVFESMTEGNRVSGYPEDNAGYRLRWRLSPARNLMPDASPLGCSDAQEASASDHWVGKSREWFDSGLPGRRVKSGR